MEEVLKGFFAVTTTSVYHIQDNVNGYPEVKKIALKGESQIAIGTKLKNGTMVSVGNQIIVFIPEGYGWMAPMTSFERRIEHVNTQWWGGGTSKVVALFLKKSDALECHNSPDLQPCDLRWLESTKDVLRKIDKNHPHFSIAESPSMRLMDPKEI